MTLVKLYPRRLSKSEFSNGQIKRIKAEARDIAHGDQNQSELLIGGRFFILAYRLRGWSLFGPVAIKGPDFLGDGPVFEFSNRHFLLIPVTRSRVFGMSTEFVDEAFDLIAAKYWKTADEPETQVAPVTPLRPKRSLLSRIFGTSVGAG